MNAMSIIPEDIINEWAIEAAKQVPYTHEPLPTEGFCFKWSPKQLKGVFLSYFYEISQFLDDDDYKRLFYNDIKVAQTYYDSPKIHKMGPAGIIKMESDTGACAVCVYANAVCERTDLDETLYDCEGSSS
jgi:hypothetical protein